MKNLLNLFLEPKTNGAEITFLLTKFLNVKISDSTIKKEFEEHPDYPSLLSISDILSNYGIDNLSISIDTEKLYDIPTPFITQLKGKVNDLDFFTVVKQIKHDQTQYFDPEKHIWASIATVEFLKQCSGIVLLTEVQEGAGEKIYREKILEERKLLLTHNLMAVWLPVVAIMAGVIAFLQIGAHALIPFVFLLITLTGSIVGLLLIWYELDQYNPILQQLCGARKKVNCSAILQSKASKIAGISWSMIGFSYFAGNLIVQIFWGVASLQTLFVSAWLNVLAVPYVFYSVYYQWRIAKQWCVLCLFVQGILILQLITTLIGGWHGLFSPDIVRSEVFIQMITAFAIPFMGALILLPALVKAKERKSVFNELQRLKHDPQIFSALLEKQPALSEIPNSMGIVIGNPDAPYKIIKVCNPYCGPCAKAHVPMDELLHNNSDVQIQIIFIAKSNEDDIRSHPVKHLLAINENRDESIVKKALDDWYLSDDKDYIEFAAKYPMNGELKRQIPKIDAMDAWCERMGIEYTPTFFISVAEIEGRASQYYKLPEMYSVADLKYFLSV